MVTRCWRGTGNCAVCLTQVRGAWIAIPIMIWLMAGWFPSYPLGHRRLAATAAIAAVTGLLLLVPVTQARILETFNEIYHLHKDPTGTRSTTLTYSIRCRLELWRSGWILFSEHPWSGVGAGRYRLETERLAEGGHISATACGPVDYWSAKHAHSDWVQLGAELGIPGIMTYLLPLAIIYAIGRYCCRQHGHTVGVSLKIYAAGHGLFSLTQTQFSHNISTTFFALTAAILVALAFNELEVKRHTHPYPSAGSPPLPSRKPHPGMDACDQQPP